MGARKDLVLDKGKAIVAGARALPLPQSEALADVHAIRLKILLALTPILYKITAYCLNIQCPARRMLENGAELPLSSPAALHGTAIPWRP
ncbi:hypothetical protein [Cupriavidus taiwanensis]|uniref:hypothetical protein n=1 Tax=Cupriavidus taiwanensis TaxID=164546 RepID=UPI001F010400|nr:hypothetical protein [Cupriavidus taiwanensis]